MSSAARDAREPARTELIAGKYEVLETLGEGPAGTTYRVRHPMLDAVRRVTMVGAELTEDPVRFARLEQAVRQASRLQHENIAPVIDFAEEMGRYLLVEGALDGEPLAQTLRRGGAFAPADALGLARRLAAALGYAHERGVVHGALSPASVSIGREAPPVVQLSGFALGPLVEVVSAYAPPERLAGADPDARGDVFALGLILFELLEGRALFAGTEDEIRAELLDDAGPLVPRFSCILPPGAAPLVARAIRRRAAERYQSMAEVCRDIDACLARIAQPTVAPATPSGDVPARRRIVVVDESVEELADSTEPRPLPASGAAARARTPIPRLPGRVLIATGRPSRPSRAPLVIAAGLLVFALMAMAVRPLLHDEVSEPSPVPTEPAPLPAVEDVPVVAIEPEVPAAVVSEPAEEAPPAVVPEPTTEIATPDVPEPAPAPNQPPKIVSHRPRAGEAVSISEGGALDFGARATDDAGDEPAYVWFLDGRRVARGPSWHLVAPPAAATALTVELEVTDAAGLKAPRLSWSVEVTPRMTDENVRDWLGQLAAAWERRDVATLRRYGIVRGDADAKTLREVLPDDAHRIALANEAIWTDGAYATVAFDRKETDERGKLVGSQREWFQLEKHPGGVVTLRGR